ncbi:MAG: restriction endonuclease subunit S [Salipiger marinus]|uniref:restriction endonuclease subunit S n=1 Tax=Salipiger marinus TaxID=555512 RepID=UPI0040599082
MNWPVQKFASLVSDGKHSIVGGPFGSKLTSRDYVEDGVPVIRGANMGGGRHLDERDFVFVSEAKKNKDLQSNLARPGDIVFTQRGTLGQVAIIPNESAHKEYVVSQSQMRATLDPDKACKQFYYYFFSSRKVVETILNLTSSSGVPHINLGTLKDFDVPVPDLPTQERIAGVLSAYDDLIENNRRRIALLEQVARLLYREWFVHFRFPGYETAKFVDGLPEGWGNGTLGDLMTLKRGYDLPTSKRFEGDIPIVSSSGFSGFHNAKMADGPGIVTGRYGTIGEVYFVDGPYWPLNTALYVSDKKNNPPLYLFHALKQILQNIQSEKAAVPGVNRNVLHGMRVGLPPQEIKAAFEEKLLPIRDQKRVLTEANKKLAKARDLLLPRLMDGRLPIPE